VGESAGGGAWGEEVCGGEVVREGGVGERGVVGTAAREGVGWWWWGVMGREECVWGDGDHEGGGGG